MKRLLGALVVAAIATTGVFAQRWVTDPAIKNKAEELDKVAKELRDMLEIDGLLDNTKEKYEVPSDLFVDPAERDAAINKVLAAIGGTAWYDAKNKGYWVFGNQIEDVSSIDREIQKKKKDVIIVGFVNENLNKVMYTFKKNNVKAVERALVEKDSVTDEVRRIDRAVELTFTSDDAKSMVGKGGMVGFVIPIQHTYELAGQAASAAGNVVVDKTTGKEYCATCGQERGIRGENNEYKDSFCTKCGTPFNVIPNHYCEICGRQYTTNDEVTTVAKRELGIDKDGDIQTYKCPNDGALMRQVDSSAPVVKAVATDKSTKVGLKLISASGKTGTSDLVDRTSYVYKVLNGN